VACVRLALASSDEDVITRTADALRVVTHDRDVALVIDSHVMMVERLGLDGVHLTDAARTIKAVRKTLGDDAIIGSHCYTSRHNRRGACGSQNRQPERDHGRRPARTLAGIAPMWLANAAQNPCRPTTRNGARPRLSAPCRSRIPAGSTGYRAAHLP